MTLVHTLDHILHHLCSRLSEFALVVNIASTFPVSVFFFLLTADFFFFFKLILGELGGSASELWAAVGTITKSGSVSLRIKVFFSFYFQLCKSASVLL